MYEGMKVWRYEENYWCKGKMQIHDANQHANQRCKSIMQESQTTTRTMASSQKSQTLKRHWRSCHRQMLHLRTKCSMGTVMLEFSMLLIRANKVTKELEARPMRHQERTQHKPRSWGALKRGGWQPASPWTSTGNRRAAPVFLICHTEIWSIQVNQNHRRSQVR